MIIEKMNLNDLEEIKNVLTTSFDDFWNYSILKNELCSENSIYFLARNTNNEIVGFAGMKIVLDEAEIMNIVTKKNCRNQGIGKSLLNRLIWEAQNRNLKVLHLEVNENNTIAIHLYENFGFIRDGKRKNYYNNENAILMSKILEK